MSCVAQSVVGVVQGAQNEAECVTSFSKTSCLCCYVCISLFIWSSMIMEILHNHLHLHHFRQCHSVVQVLSEEKKGFFDANS
jgi:hypothetical protein